MKRPPCQVRVLRASLDPPHLCVMLYHGRFWQCEGNWECSMLDVCTGAASKRAMVELSHGSSRVIAAVCFGNSTRCGFCWRSAPLYQDSHTSKASRQQLRRNPHESIVARNRKRFQSKRGRSNREHDEPRSLLRKQPANFKENSPLHLSCQTRLQQYFTA